MRAFLREYWPWIVIPFVLVLLGLALVYFLTGDEGSSPFQYNVF